MQLPSQKAHPSHQTLAAELCQPKHGQIEHQALSADSLAEFHLRRVSLQGIMTQPMLQCLQLLTELFLTGLLKAECFVTQDPCLALPTFNYVFSSTV